MTIKRKHQDLIQGCRKSLNPSPCPNRPQSDRADYTQLAQHRRVNTGLIFKDPVHAVALLATQTTGLPCRSNNAELAISVSSPSGLDVCCVFIKLTCKYMDAFCYMQAF